MTKRSNRLIKEKSPYLLQHAYNPVDWRPWSEEAFQSARKGNKPIFLSIGYSTCHWCHVMKKESFEDQEVAKLLNENFISVKVDREERPDIDNIYMKVCLLMTGSGGWPLTVLMTPDKHPFFVGTYIPKHSKFGRIGLIDLLKNSSNVWSKNPQKLIETSTTIAGHLRTYVQFKRQEGKITDEIFDEAFRELTDAFDDVNGGFGTYPKFPTVHNLLFLLRYWARSGRRQALDIVEKTLRKMRIGGIFDQVGYGFHRYSVDTKWLVPHFEKMLYDQAMISIAYIEAYRATGNKIYRRTAEEVFEYVLRDMSNPRGGFFSAEDADSEGEEGKFYLWTEKEVRATLRGDAELIQSIFSVSKKGNFRDAAASDTNEKNILHLEKTLEDYSLEFNLDLAELTFILEKARKTLFSVRETRIHPQKDAKILTDWNGLMVAALAKGAQIFGEIRYTEMAKKTVEFILENLQAEDGRLLHRYKDGEAVIPGNVNDYAFFIWGLIELYGATFQKKYLEEAIRLQDAMMDHFWDNKNNGFYFTAHDSEKVLLRNKEFDDGAIPSGNSVALSNLSKLARITGRTKYEENATSLVKAFLAYSKGSPTRNTMFLSSFDFLRGPSYEIVLVGDLQSPETRNMLATIRTRFIPNKVILHKNDGALEKIASFTKDMKKIDNKVTVYICRNFACSTPTTDINKVVELLDGTV